MNEVFIFDVDGTLTPSRDLISEEFRDFFMQFCNNNDVYLVSGSDYAKTLEQLGDDITNDFVKLIYSCSGNSIWEHSIEIYKSDWVLPDIARKYLMSLVESSDCPTKIGNHIEDRIGMINFSTLGHSANKEQRAEYIQFDISANERVSITEKFNTCYGTKLGCTALIGGETGVDITRTGADKRQILKYFDDRIIHFFGDHCEEGGNDYPLAKAIADRARDGDKVYHVKDWHDTMERLTNHR